MNLTAEFNTNKGRGSGTVVKLNTKTLWVRFKEFENKKEKIKDFVVPKYKIIKRHLFKHNVVMKGEV